jgi:RimJ/RimL family protein N-acetyltransferase
MIGSSRYAEYDEAKSEIEIGWTFLARSHWGGRYNAEMKRLMLTHAFRFVRRVVFRVGPNNRRSQRALEKIGATYVGIESHPQRADAALFEITRESFVSAN